MLVAKENATSKKPVRLVLTGNQQVYSEHLGTLSIPPSHRMYEVG